MGGSGTTGNGATAGASFTTEGIAGTCGGARGTAIVGLDGGEAEGTVDTGDTGSAGDTGGAGGVGVACGKVGTLNASAVSGVEAAMVEGGAAGF